MFFMTRIDAHTTVYGMIWRVLLLGIGLGPAQSLFSVAIQNAVPMDRIGVATSSSQFFRQIGGTVGATIFGAIMTQSLAAQMAKVASKGGTPMTIDKLQALAVANQAAGGHGKTIAVDPLVRAAFSTAMADVFMAGMVIAILGLVVTLFVPELPLRARAPGQQKAEPVAEPGEGAGAGELGEETPEPQGAT
jgi:hypothetical protein